MLLNREFPRGGEENHNASPDNANKLSRKHSRWGRENRVSSFDGIGLPERFLPEERNKAGEGGQIVLK